MFNHRTYNFFLFETIRLSTSSQAFSNSLPLSWSASKLWLVMCQPKMPEFHLYRLERACLYSFCLFWQTFYKTSNWHLGHPLTVLQWCCTLMCLLRFHEHIHTHVYGFMSIIIRSSSWTQSHFSPCFSLSTFHLFALHLTQGPTM